MTDDHGCINADPSPIKGDNVELIFYSADKEQHR